MILTDVTKSVGGTPLEALAIAARKDFAGRLIVVLLADTGERYITTELFRHDADAVVFSA